MSDGSKCSIMFLFDISCWVWIRMSFERKCMSYSKRIYLKERIIFLQACGQMLGNQGRLVSHPGTNHHRQELLPLAWDVSKRSGVSGRWWWVMSRGSYTGVMALEEWKHYNRSKAGKKWGKNTLISLCNFTLGFCQYVPSDKPKQKLEARHLDWLSPQRRTSQGTQ